MTDRYIGCAENDKDVSAAIFLIKKVFFSNINSEKFLLPNKTLIKKNVVVIKIKNKVVASSLVNDRFLYLKNDKIPCSFLSCICVDDQYRGKGFSRLLIDFTIQLCKSRGKKACFVIARKSADFFYNKFSFYGFSNYPKIVINKGNFHYRKKLIFSSLKRYEIDEIKETYSQVYQKILGSFFRNNEYWHYIIKKGKKINVKLCIIRDHLNNTLGYICYNKGNIYELALNNSEDYCEVLVNVMKIENLDSIIFHGGTNHPLANEIEIFDYTFSYRRCWYGGHMIRIIDQEFFSNLFSNEKQKKKTSKNPQSKFYIKCSKLFMEIKEKDIFPNEFRNIPLMDQV